MRNLLRSLLLLLCVSGVLAGTVQAQQPRIVPGGRSLVMNTPNQGTPQGRQGLLSGSGPLGGPQSLTALCGPDTVLYPFAKASNLVLVDIAGGVGLGQWYPAPQPITVHGFTFYAFVDSATSQTVDIICNLYAAGLDSLPTGAILASDTVTIDSSSTPLSLGVLQKFANFTPAVTINGPYVITVENQSLIDVAFVTSDYSVGDGQQEWLADVFLPPNWERSYNIVLGTSIFDCDVMLFPHVTYDVTASFTPGPVTSCTGQTINFTNTSSPVLFDRFYNIDAFNVFWAGNPDSSFVWDYGNGSGNDYAIDGSVTYVTPGTFTVSLSDTMYAWTVTCTDQTTTTATIGSGSPPVANFASVPSGLTVAFADLSTGAPTSWAWDFGDGGTSTLQNPSHTYALQGTYTVCLIVSNNCGADTLCQTVTVVGCNPPVANWTSITAGLNVSFTDLSTNTPTSWVWDFGDGSPVSTLQNPTHTYATVGSFTVCLLATNACGSDTTCFTINTGCNSPVAGFTRVITQLTVAFTDASSGTPTSWFWDFGDGNTSTVQNPTHVYAQSGTYTVCLTATNTCGSNTTCQTITVSCPTPTASFTFTMSALTVNFTSTSTGSPTSYAWDFGDGGTSTVQNPTHVYAQGGTYQVCLTVTNACGSNTVCQNITLNCPMPNSNFSFTSINLAYNFQDLTTGGPTTWFWDFGDGNTSTLQNPSHTYANTGTYNVCLVTTNACGPDTNCQAVTVLCPQPSASFSTTMNQLVVGFNDLSGGNPTSWSWNFGDGSPTSIQSNPTHTYAAPGTYQVCLTVVNACGSNTFCQSITVACPAPSPNFNFSTLGNTTTFTNQTVGSGVTYVWDFGDGNTSTLTNPVHSYSAVGNYTVCLVATSVCGADTFCRTVIITCVPPVANFTSVNVNDSTVNFTNNASPNSTSWVWTFGDGSPSTTVANPTHVYPAAGTYTACLIVSNNCGFDTLCQTITITCSMPTSGYIANVTNSTATFSDVSIGAQSWYWTFGDGLSSTQQSPTHTYSQSGIYQVCLTVTNFCGTNTFCQNLVITCNPPVSQYQFQFGTSTVGFTDLSTNSPTSWFWAFGDGNVSTQQNPTHGFLFAGQYYVCLTATNACGANSFCQWINVTVVGEEDASLVEGSLNLYPNPSSGLFHLNAELRKAAEVRIRVTNVLGQQVWASDLGRRNGGFEAEIDLTGLSKGMYILELSTDGVRTFKNLIVD